MSSRRLSVLFILFAAPGVAQLTIASLSPANTVVGAPAFTLTVNGAGFSGLNIVQWNSANVPTTFVSSTQLTASITAAQIATTGTNNVRVRLGAFINVFSNTVTFAVLAQLPTLTSLSPSSTTAGGPALNLTATGLNFAEGATIRMNGVNLPTTYGSPTSVSASVSAALLADGATHVITVRNPTAVGGTSSALNWTVSNPAPTIAGTTPGFVPVGVGGTITINGSGFVPSSTIAIGSQSATSTFVGSTAISAVVPAGVANVAGAYLVQVFSPTPGGGNAALFGTFTVNNPAPATTTISPSNVVVGGPAFAMIVNGSGFVASSVVRVDGVSIATTFVNATQLTASVPNSMIATTGPRLVTVFTAAPGGGTAAALSLNVNNPLPAITGLTPPSLLLGVGPTVISVTGSGFVGSSVVFQGAEPLTTNMVTAQLLIVTIPASLTAGTGAYPLHVLNPAPGGGPSNAFVLSVNNPIAQTTQLNPSTFLSDAGAVAFTMTGGGYTTSTTVTVDGAAIPTLLINANLMSATMPASVTSVAGLHSITTSNPAPGGGGNTLNFNVSNPTPTLVSVAPSSFVVGAGAQSVTITGAHFVPGITARVNSVSVATTFVDGGTVTAIVPASVTAVVGTYFVDVQSPGPGGGGSPSNLQIEVVNPVPTVTAVSPASLPAGSIGHSISIVGAGFIPTSSVSFGGLSLFTTFVTPTALQAFLPAAATATAGTTPITVFTPSPGGGASNSSMFDVTNPTPAATSLFPASLFVGSADTSLTISGTGFVIPSIVSAAGFGPLATSFIDAQTLQAVVPAALLAAFGQLSLTVQSPSPGGGGSSPVVVDVVYPAPVVSSMFPTSFAGGGPDTPLTFVGSGFIFETNVYAKGIPLVKTSTTPTQIDCLFPAALSLAVGTIDVLVGNPFPIGGTDERTVTITGGTISSVSPNVMPVLNGSSAPVVLTITGEFSQFAGAIAHVNGAAVPTTAVSATTYTCSIGPSVAAALAPGGFALTLVKFTATSAVASNAVGVAVGTAGAFDNAGTVSVLPRSPLAGEPFMIRVEAPAEFQLLTLLVDFAPQPPSGAFIVPGFDLLVGVLAGPTIAVVDGFGLLGPTTGTLLGPNDLSPLVPGPRGTFDIYGLVAPAVPFGVTMALQAVYGDPSSPVFVNATWVNAPQTL